MATSRGAATGFVRDGASSSTHGYGISGADSANGAVIERQMLRDRAHEAILELLLDGRVEPGESLSIDGLARELGVSPTPVREALGQLEHTGLVTRTALKGYRAAPPLTPERTAELLDARAVVEVAGIRAAVPVADDVLAELDSLSATHRAAAGRVRKMVKSARGKLDWPTLRRYYTIDWEFHLTILRSSHNRYLLQMADGLAPHVHRLRQSMRHGVIDVEQAVAEHAVILDSIRSGDPDAAATAMADHIAAVKVRALADG